jgi:hypothetical protein
MRTLNDEPSPTPPEPDPDKHLTALLGMMKDLVSLMADPAATKKRLEQLAAAHADAQASSFQAACDAAEARRLKADIEAELEAARAAHIARMDDERAKHDAKIGEQAAEAADKQRRAAELLAKAEADASAATKIKDTLTKKLAALTSAA